eukprot:CAMPEP_0168338160 /NCGR_PEP_ID=MMETSP0213-20121227/12661_1 /TAXON_ID=151035 /ORGANISM="Euplotes harpa, Strain FSP1.4" /LENGTH=148 /DNA_ID=CAMNT_0008343869 /DNA_START=318 /DNA_END=761 /DNA_ORIENTATION=+
MRCKKLKNADIDDNVKKEIIFQLQLIIFQSKFKKTETSFDISRFLKAIWSEDAFCKIYTKTLTNLTTPIFEKCIQLTHFIHDDEMKTAPSTDLSAAHSSPHTSDDLTPPMQYFLRTVYTPDDITIGMETALMKAELDELPEKAKQFAV